MNRLALSVALFGVIACGRAGRNGAGADGGGGGGGGGGGDGGGHLDGGGDHLDGGGDHLDGGGDHLDGGTTTGIITGGPCSSGSPGATAYRVTWADGGGTAYVMYDVNGLPDHSRDHTDAYGYEIGFTPSFVDPFLGAGGVALDDDDFIDIELSTVGVSAIASATLSIFGRSYNVDTSGSFNWQTFVDTGSAPTDLVSNVAPYAWYSADMTSALAPGDYGALIRIKAGPSSDSLVVNQIELCLQAN